jgi:hypothetical protein
MEKNNFIFVATDPLNRKIELKADTWEHHIKEKHGEDLITDDTIKNNIENPIYIVKNVKPEYDGSKNYIVDERRQDYWGLIGGEEHFYAIKTIVEFVQENKGIVVTTYIITNLKEMRTIGGIVYDGTKNESTG